MTRDEYESLEQYAERYARHKGECQEVHIKTVSRAYMDGYMTAMRKVREMTELKRTVTDLPK